eukprot:3581578-Pyramimonas_sp.AAC.1
MEQLRVAHAEGRPEHEILPRPPRADEARHRRPHSLPVEARIEVDDPLGALLLQLDARVVVHDALGTPTRQVGNDIL